jgi:hypothetical protein
MSKTPYFGLPSRVLFFKHSVISNQRPSSTVEFKYTKDDKKRTIGFDVDGTCGACRCQEIKAVEIYWERSENALLMSGIGKSTDIDTESDWRLTQSFLSG